MKVFVTFRELFYGTTNIWEKIAIGNIDSRSAIRTIRKSYGSYTTLVPYKKKHSGQFRFQLYLHLQLF